MPHATVYYDPHAIGRSQVNQLKQALPAIIASAFDRGYAKGTPGAEKMLPKLVAVFDHRCNPTDVNTMALEIRIDAGMSLGRSVSRVARLIGEALLESPHIPPNLFVAEQSSEQVGVWMRFLDGDAIYLVSKLPRKIAAE